MIGAVTCAIIALAFALPASAQDFPTRPARFIVPFSTGGATDTLARHGARKLSEATLIPGSSSRPSVRRGG